MWLTSDSRLQQRSMGCSTLYSPRRLAQSTGLAPLFSPRAMPHTHQHHREDAVGRRAGGLRHSPRPISVHAARRNAGAWAGISREVLPYDPFHPTPPRPSPLRSTTPRGPGLQPKPINASLNLPQMHAHHLDVHIPTKDAVRRPKSRPIMSSVLTAVEAMASLTGRKQELMDHLDEFDTSGDGKLNLDELQQLLRIMDLAQGREAWLLAKELMQTLDDDGTGLVDRHEFFRDMKTNKVDSKGDLEDFADFEDPAAAREEYRLSVIMKRKERKGRKADRAMQSIYGAKEGKFFANRLPSSSRSPSQSPELPPRSHTPSQSSHVSPPPMRVSPAPPPTPEAGSHRDES